MRISVWSSDVCSSDLLILRHARRREGRLAIARASHRMIAERARGHVLPYQTAEPVGVVTILRGFDMDMLAEHVEAGLLPEDVVAACGFLGRRVEQAFGHSDWVERAVLDMRFVIAQHRHLAGLG